MSQRVIRVNSMSGEVMSLLAQVGVVTRRMMSVMLYREAGDATEQYVTHTLTVTKAMTRLAEKQYVAKVHDSKTGKNYYHLTAEGWKCVDALGLPYSEWVRTMSINNKQELGVMIRNATALYAGRSMRVCSLPSEKPVYGDLANKVGSLTYFEVADDVAQIYPADVINREVLPNGVCYSIAEIREAYEKSNSELLAKNSSIRIGMMFFSNRIVTLLPYASRKAMFSKRAELEFDNSVYKDFERLGALRDVEKVAYIYAPTFVTLPTFFHGCVDGIQPRQNKPGKKDILEENKTKFKLDKLPQYDKVYFMPQGTSDSSYRQGVDEYTQKVYNADEERFRNLRPDVKGKIIICRYPELKQLRKAFRANDAISIVGPSDPVLVDCLSRCMRTSLRGYYDIETGKEVPFTHYSHYGMPLVGNSNQIDYDAPLHRIGEFGKTKSK